MRVGPTPRPVQDQGIRHAAVDAFVADLSSIAWVGDIWLYGSLATGDHRPGVSDIDLVTLITHALGEDDLRLLCAMHRRIDRTVGMGGALGCAYVDAAQLGDTNARHPTWTHGRLVHRRLSSMVRAELLTHGQVLVGRQPGVVLSPMSASDIRAAALGELAGYWSWAARRPWLFLRPELADLALLSMARIRHTLATGDLISKTQAITQVRAPQVIVEGILRRRSSPGRAFPPAPRTAHHAWHDTRRTIAQNLP